MQLSIEFQLLVLHWLLLSQNQFIQLQTNSPKEIEYWISMGTLKNLPQRSFLHGKNQVEILETAVRSGFVGVAGINSEIASKLFESLNLKYASAIAFSNLRSGMRFLKEAADLRVSSVTIHLGNGLNSDREADSWIDKILSFSTESHIPVLFETHRGTVLQDIFRTIRFLEKYPEIRLVGDFSHWYTGLLLGNDFEEKIKLMELIFQRTEVIHGRIASDGCIQPALRGLNSTVKRHFKALWLSVFEKSMSDETAVPFIVELLGHEIGYDPGNLSGNLWEDSTDRWEDALQLKKLMQHWYQENTKQL